MFTSNPIHEMSQTFFIQQSIFIFIDLLMQHFYGFGKLCAIRGNVPKVGQLLIFTSQYMWQNAKDMPIFQLDMPTCQKAYRFFNLARNRAKSHANFSNWHVRISIFQYHLPAGVPFFQLFSKKIFLNFSIMLNICKFQEYLDNSRAFILQNKVSKF